MSLFSSPEVHAANPPATWVAKKVSDRRWALCSAGGVEMDAATTKKAAESLKVSGFLVELYKKETRWYAGETPDGWKPYAVVVAENERRAARNVG